MDFSHYEISQQTPTPTKPSEDQSPVNVTERIKALKIDLELPKPFNGASWRQPYKPAP